MILGQDNFQPCHSLIASLYKVTGLPAEDAEQQGAQVLNGGHWLQTADEQRFGDVAQETLDVRPRC